MKNTPLKPMKQTKCKESAAHVRSQRWGRSPCSGLSRNSIAEVRLRGRRRAGALLPWRCRPEREFAVGRAASLKHASYPRAHLEEEDVEEKLSQDMSMKSFLTRD